MLTASEMARRAVGCGPAWKSPIAAHEEPVVQADTSDGSGVTASATKQRGSGRRVCFRIGGDPPPVAGSGGGPNLTEQQIFAPSIGPTCSRSRESTRRLARSAARQWLSGLPIPRPDDFAASTMTAGYGTVNFVSYTGSSRKHWLQPASSQAGARLGRNPGRRTTGKPCCAFFVVCSGVMELKSVVKGHQCGPPKAQHQKTQRPDQSAPERVLIGSKTNPPAVGMRQRG